MAYVVHTFDEVEAYLRGLEGISEGGRRRVVEAYLRDLAEHADDFLHRVPSPTSRTPFSTSTC